MMASSVFDEAEMSPRYSRCLSLRSPMRGLPQQLAEADDVGERGAQLVGHVADEGVLHAVAGDERVVALFQRPLVALGVGHVGEGDQRGAVGQRHRRIVDDGAVGPHHLALDSLALLGE